MSKNSIAPTRATLLDLACRSALWRISWTSDGRLELPKDCHVSALAADMEQLGRAAREAGVDVRDSPFWVSLECHEAYRAAFDRNRQIFVKHLTPMAIFDSLCRGSKLCYFGWVVTVGGSREVTGDYGESAWETRVWLRVPGAEALEEYSGISRSLARTLYRRIVGRDFEFVDTLGIDGPHPAEGHSLDEVLDHMEWEGTLPLVASEEQGPRWEAFAKLSVEDPSACLALFDRYGRYRELQSGFWASLRCERYDEATGQWYRSVDLGDRGRY
ncbi:hypothetical protein BLA39750_01326 [Burkholderia lata]|uniref:Uncharacterized protein n=1 Tax=Burkholderia lata (strain ATCC 17760 / DSM 23089 / LMG 22485 / NCIMB 9086 / R18194 / 383) TaxID=482957 RepID=A0A6P2VMT7_BURL3|nr:hypothetical protein BLA39750_01326 [Burkholderia lata]